MSNIFKSVWIDVLFILTIVSLLFAGMRGFKGFFPFVLSIAFLYFALIIYRLFQRKNTR